MTFFSTTSTAVRTALIYITAGTLSVIWTGVWFVALLNNPPETATPYYWCMGLTLSGLALIGIGFGIGSIGKAARNADAAPAVVATTRTDANAVAPVPAVAAPVQTTAPVTVPVNNGRQQPVRVS